MYEKDIKDQRIKFCGTRCTLALIVITIFVFALYVILFSKCFENMFENDGDRYISSRFDHMINGRPIDGNNSIIDEYSTLTEDEATLLDATNSETSNLFNLSNELDEASKFLKNITLDILEKIRDAITPDNLESQFKNSNWTEDLSTLINQNDYLNDETPELTNLFLPPLIFPGKITYSKQVESDKELDEGQKQESRIKKNEWPEDSGTFTNQNYYSNDKTPELTNLYLPLLIFPGKITYSKQEESDKELNKEQKQESEFKRSEWSEDLGTFTNQNDYSNDESPELTSLFLPPLYFPGKTTYLTQEESDQENTFESSKDEGYNREVNLPENSNVQNNEDASDVLRINLLQNIDSIGERNTNVKQRQTNLPQTSRENKFVTDRNEYYFDAYPNDFETESIEGELNEEQDQESEFENSDWSEDLDPLTKQKDYSNDKTPELTNSFLPPLIFPGETSNLKQDDRRNSDTELDEEQDQESDFKHSDWSEDFVTLLNPKYYLKEEIPEVMNNLFLPPLIFPGKTTYSTQEQSDEELDEEQKQEILSRNNFGQDSASQNQIEPFISTNSETLEHEINVLHKLNYSIMGFSTSNNFICPDYGKNLTLLIAIQSDVNNFEQRQVIRETWAKTTKLSNININYTFIVGIGISDSIDNKIMDEADKFQDIIQTDILGYDTFRDANPVMLLKWVKTFCPYVNYVIKADDNVFLNVPKIAKLIQKYDVMNNAMYGDIYVNEIPNRNPESDDYVPKELFSEDFYPPFLNHVGYLFSGELAVKLYDEIERLPYYFPLENILITGIIAEKLNIPRENSSEYFIEYSKVEKQMEKCSFLNYIVVFPVTPQQMKLLWNEIKSTGFTCFNFSENCLEPLT